VLVFFVARDVEDLVAVYGVQAGAAVLRVDYLRELRANEDGEVVRKLAALFVPLLRLPGDL
jgi:hypothetical protein